jgi:hypothetical protein
MPFERLRYTASRLALYEILFYFCKSVSINPISFFGIYFCYKLHASKLVVIVVGRRAREPVYGFCVTRGIDDIVWSVKGSARVFFAVWFHGTFVLASLRIPVKNLYLPVPCKIVKACNSEHNTHSSVKGRKNEVTPLNIKSMFLIFVVFLTVEVTNRDLNAVGSDIRGSIALPSLDG